MQKHRHLPRTAAARALLSSVLANRTYLVTLNIILRFMGIDPLRVDPTTKTFLEAAQRRKEYFARRSRTIVFKKNEAARLKAAKVRAEEAKKRSKEQKHAPYKTMAQKVIKPKKSGQKTGQQRARTTIAAEEAPRGRRR